jgi:hypothetical protein
MEERNNRPQISLHYHLNFNLEHKETCVGKQECQDSHETLSVWHPKNPSLKFT